MDENSQISDLDNESLNDYNIYKEVIDILKNKNLTSFIYNDGIIWSMNKDFYYWKNNQRKFFFYKSKIIYFTNKDEKIKNRPFFIHDQDSLDRALNKTKIKNGILKNVKNIQENDFNKPCDSTYSKSSFSTVNSYQIDDILKSDFDLIKESGVKYIFNEECFNVRFFIYYVKNLDFNFKYIQDNYINNKIDNDDNLNNYLNNLNKFVKENKTKSYCYIFGPRGIGKTTLLLKYLTFYDFPRLYFSLKIMSKPDFNNRRLKKYALKETIYTFDDISQMKKFSDINVSEIPDYSSNLLEFILSYIKILMNFYSKENKKRNKIWIVIDDYNQELYDKNNIIEKIIEYIDENKTKLFLCILGDGKYINEKYYQYYSNKDTNYFAIYWNHSIINEISQKNKILTLPKYYYKYKDSNNINFVEKIIQENIMETFKKMNLNSLLFLSKIIKTSINIKNFKDELINLPLEYLTIERHLDEDKNILLNISFNTEIYKTVFDSTIKGLLKIDCLKTKSIIFKEDYQGKNGIDFEDLIIEQLWNNTFDFLIFPDENKLIVEEIFKLKYNENDIRNDLNIENPIIIRQKVFKGKYYDLLFILNIKNKIYAIFIQIGLSKKGNDIDIYLRNLIDNEDKYKEGIKTLINHNIDEIGFLLIFDYNHQKTLLDKNNKSEGVGFCEENEIDFLIYKDFNLYKNINDNEPIKSFDVTEKTLIINDIYDTDNEITNETDSIKSLNKILGDKSKKNFSEPLYPLNVNEKSLIFNSIKNDYDELIFLFSAKNINEKGRFISNKLKQINVFKDNNNKYFCYDNKIFEITNNQLKIIKNRKKKNNNLDIYFLNKKTNRKPDLDN